MTIEAKDFRVPEGHAVHLGHWPTRIDPVYSSKKHYRRQLEERVAALSKQQELLYASNRHALLLIFQAMDSAGKDGAIKHVMSGVNPQGCQVFSFKHPSAADCSTISCGVPPATYLNADGSASSTAPITRKY